MRELTLIDASKAINASGKLPICSLQTYDLRFRVGKFHGFRIQDCRVQGFRFRVLGFRI